MRLKFYEKWKWYAVDSNEEVYVYTVRPEYGGNGRWDIDRTAGGLSMWVNTELIEVPDIRPGSDSLHEILEDGTLVKRPALRVDDKVLVRDSSYGTWIRRHFAGWEESGRILTFYGGATSWADGSETVSWAEWKLPEEE
jgi:hypothetical protein